MTIIVVGAGLAGGTAVTELRDRGYDGRLILIGSESHPPYERPPLSKGYLLGNDPIEDALVHEERWYAEHDVDFRPSTTVTGLDPAAHRVTAGGETLGYDKLLLATGSTPRTFRLAEEAGTPTAYLRTIEDSDRLKVAFAAGAKIVVVGAGWIGLEVTAAARGAGCEVTVFEQAELPLVGVLGPEIAQVFADLHRAHGVDLRLGTPVTADDLAAADLVVVGIGVAPNTELAETAGLQVDDGVLVDAQLRTSDPDVYAVGDIANHDHPTLGRRVRVEHWETAIEQAKTAAHNLAGAAEPYERLPYFFTDQYDLGMEYVGSVGPDGYDRVDVDGDLSSVVTDQGSFRAFWVKDGTVVAALHVNDWDASEVIRESIGTRR
ncbi:FAD-dependent oxidoreductase [Microlunatus aurantiacus]|uniref:FAD-dependent oxidoreductase n=1 Tax=Microlunatus aurantiacus TaxID=446786 RepID=A0ABP7DB14_9ACTN